ncbi:MAG: DMT family transporter, partial [Candidatus Kapabacteria bacterium]|nr:DMT family transporter [Candidatus Kapabacteria bacterium]
MLIGILAACGTLFSWSFGTLSFLNASRRIDPGLLNRTRLLLAVGATMVLACITMQVWPWGIFTLAGGNQWLWLGISGVVGLSIGDLLGFTSLRILGARRQSVVGTSAPAAAAIAAFFLLHESLTLQHIIGMGLSIAGVMYAMSAIEERSEVSREGYGSFATGVILAIGGAVCQGAGLVLAKVGLQADGGNVSPFHATFMRMSVGFAATYLLDVIRRAPHRPLRDAFTDKQGARSMYFGTLFGPIIGVTCSLIAASHLDVAVAQTIFSLVPFV